MRVRFWGVRGSLPVPGIKTERYGGNTSCVEVRSAAGTRVVVDAGTGIRKLGKELSQADGEGSSNQVHLLISHTHWDHIQGLPFFSPLYQRGNSLHVYARKRDDLHLRAVFASQTDDPYFPIPFDEAKADIAFRELIDSAEFEIADVKRRLRAAQPSVHRDRLSPVRRRRGGGLRLGHRAVLRHPVRGPVHRAAAVGRAPSCPRPIATSSRRCARASRACARAPTWSSTTPCSRPRTTAACRTTGTRARRTRSRSAAKRARASSRCFTTRPSAPTTRSTRILADAQSLVTREKIPLEVVAAYEGLEITLGRE